MYDDHQPPSGEHPEPTDTDGIATGAASASVLFRDPIAVAVAHIETALAEDLSGCSDAALSERVVACTRLVDRARALLGFSAGAWAPRQVWLGSGARSAAGWLARETNTTGAEAHRVLRTGRLLAARAEIADRVRADELSMGKADALAAVATTDRADLFARDADVLAGAIAPMTAADAQTVLQRWACLADDALAGDTSTNQHDRRRLHHSPVGATWKTDGRFDTDEGALIHAALRDAMDDPDHPERPGGPRSAEQRRADALVRLARHWLDHRNTGNGHNPVAAVHVHVTATTLTPTNDDTATSGITPNGTTSNRHAAPGVTSAGFDPSAICDLVPGGPIPRSTVQRLVCDSVIGRILPTDTGEPLDLGRRRRLFSPTQRRAMIARDGPTCVIPHCTTSVDQCHAHHHDPWDATGTTDLHNGAHVCNGHHHDIHDRGYTLTPADVPGRYTFTAPDGRTWTTPHTGWATHAA